MRHKESIELINIKSKMTCFQFRRSVMASATLTAWGWCQIQIPDLTFQFCRRTTLQTTSPSRNRRSRLTTFWSRWFKKLFGLQLTDAQTRRANRNLIEIKMCSKIMRKITSIYGSIDLSVTAKKFCSIGSCNVGVALWRPVWRRPKKSLKTSFKVLLFLLTHVSLLISKFTFLFFLLEKKDVVSNWRLAAQCQPSKSVRTHIIAFKFGKLMLLLLLSPLLLLLSPLLLLLQQLFVVL